MNIHPILFSTPMVEAILSGQKTQTRREVKPQNFSISDQIAEVTDNGLMVHFSKEGNGTSFMGTKNKFGCVGDILWVRETWCHNGLGYYRYKSTYTKDGTGFKHGFEKWKPSIHMPKAACRLFLKITSITVQRLTTINRLDCISEGVFKGVDLEDTVHEQEYYQSKFGGERFPSAYQAFSALWQSINGEKSWESNPWVWVIEFKRIEKPENFLS